MLLALAAAAAVDFQRLTQDLQDSVGRGDPGVYAAWTDPALVYVTENNEVWDRARLLADLKPLPPGVSGHSRVEDFALVRHGDVVVTSFAAQEQVDYHGQAVHTRFLVSDTWQRTPAGWRIVVEHVGAVLRDPPAAALGAAALAAYAGTYRLAEIEARIRVEGDHLVAERDGRPPAIYRPEVADLFFLPGAPRSRRVFTRDATGRVTGFADRREGEDVVWKRVG